jgi:hypothetical protein
VWFDQVPVALNSSQADFYETVVAHAKAHRGLVALNPGDDWPAAQCWLAAQADFLCAFEDDAAAWTAAPRSCTCAGKTRCVAMLHNYAGPATPGALAGPLASLAARGFSAAYITSAGEPNPYGGLPPFMGAEVAALCQAPLP